MKDRSLVQIALYAAIFAVLGLLPRFDIPFAAGVPITAQSMGAMLAGVMLGAWRGALAMVLMLFVVALGAPILAGGRGGLGVFFGPSVGFMFGFIAAAFVAGWIMQALRKAPVFPAALVAAAVGGILVMYAFGIVGMALNAKLSLLDATKASLIFIPGDAIKAVLTALIAQTVARGLPEALLSRAR
ncbi:biotin transporter BioY [Ancylobacter amanitiformis]|uniref:Biotin transporter n=1 Tax=Ancylobacter amanitiformis TaxID=217069 RepID=A0ABU0LPF0_9HYPH|nr:biotin transporter BioY [Ancylobacter amanitiformis]MDQ0510572.1 biotin transport system substrate-specific component [Ancylobacter amanitiformis]